MTITCFNDLTTNAIAARDKTVLAVVEAQDPGTIGSVLKASEEGIVRPIFIGRAAEIGKLIFESGLEPSDYETVDASSSEESLRRAIDLILSGKAAALMKGKLETAEFMKAVISKDNGLLTGSRLSLGALYEVPKYHKLLAVSDVVVNLYPDLECKRAIIENAVGMLRTLGVKKPKVAVLAAIEKVNPKMPETVDADALKQMNMTGIISDCVIEGPISFDLATIAEAAIIKGYDSPVAGDADLLIVHDIASGNILAKCLTGMAGATTAGTILGAKVPIVLTSRSAETSDKYYSIALAACLGN